MESFYILISSIVLSILISAFFSAAETAITTVPDFVLHQLKSQGNRRAEIALRLRQDKERLISAILFGNNACNVISSALATNLAINIAGSEGVVFAAFIMTILILIFAEVLPKAYAFEHAERMSLLVSPILLWITRILYPFTAVVERLISIIIKIFSPGKKDILNAHDVLRGMIDFHHYQGKVVKEDKDMLGGVLDLHKIMVEQIMVHRTNLQMIEIGKDIKEIIKEITNIPHSRIPVWKDDPDNIIGVLHIRDLLEQLTKKNLEEIRVEEFIRDPWFIANTTSVAAQLHEFRHKRTHFALVVDEYGVLQGVVTLEDILEEIVGQIEDEYDPADDSIIINEDGSYTIDGDTTIRDLNRRLDWQLSDEHANTLAGYIMYLSESIPAENDTLSIENMQILVLKKRGNRLLKLKISKVD